MKINVAKLAHQQNKTEVEVAKAIFLLLYMKQQIFGEPFSLTLYREPKWKSKEVIE